MTDRPDYIDLDCGVRLPMEAFYSIRGSGEKKALDRRRHIKVLGEKIEYSIRDMKPVTIAIKAITDDNSRLYDENQALRRKVAEMQSVAGRAANVIQVLRNPPKKQRIRVKANSFYSPGVSA